MIALIYFAIALLSYVPIARLVWRDPTSTLRMAVFGSIIFTMLWPATWGPVSIDSYILWRRRNPRKAYTPGRIVRFIVGWKSA